MSDVEKVTKAEWLYVLARSLALRTPNFFTVKGPGPGDKANRIFMEQLRILAKNRFGRDYSEQRLCPGTKFAIDFYFPEDVTAVELAFGLHNPLSEYERDLFKCFLAQDAGYSIDRLLFITKPTAYRKLQAPAPKAIAAWAEKHAGITVDVLELNPEDESR